MGPGDKSHSDSWQAYFIDGEGHSHGAHESPHCAFTISASKHNEAPAVERGRQPSYSLASKLKLALNLGKGIESCHGPNFWSLLKKGIYSLKLTEVA